MTDDNYWTKGLRRRVSRRRLLGGGAVLGAGFLAACSGASNKKVAVTSPATQAAAAATSVPTAAAAATTLPTMAAQAATGTQTSAKQPKKGGPLRIGLAADVPSLDPVWTTVVGTITLAAHLYDTLLAYDTNLKPQPVLLKDYTVSPDKLTYTFNLHEDPTFDGGRPITSADVVASIQRWGKKAPAGVALLKVVNSLQAKGDHAFVLETKEPYSLVIDSLTLGGGGPFIMTKEAAGTPTDQRVDDVTASGPFKLAEWTRGSKIVLKPRADYKSPAGPVSNAAGARTVYLDALEFSIIPDDNSRLSALQAGTIDVMPSPSADYFDQLKRNAQVEVQVNAAAGYNIFLLNNSRPPFSNRLARQAVLAATDIDKIMTASYGKNLWQPCPAVFLCGTPNESNVGMDQYNQKNVAKAKQLFQQLQQSGGYDGRPVILLGSTLFPLLNESQVMKPLLESIGFKVDLQTPDFATAVSLREDKNKWDLFHTGSVNGLGANDPLRSLALSPTWYGWYQSPEMDALKREYSLATAPEQQKAVIDRVQALWYQDVPDLLLGQQQVYDAYRTYVKGYSTAPNRSIFWNVWLDK